MKVNDRFEINQDPRNPCCWIVTEHIRSERKDAESGGVVPVHRKRPRYYPTLEQAALAVLEMTAPDSDAEARITRVTESIRTAKDEIIRAVREERPSMESGRPDRFRAERRAAGA